MKGQNNVHIILGLSFTSEARGIQLYLHRVSKVGLVSFPNSICVA